MPDHKLPKEDKIREILLTYKFYNKSRGIIPKSERELLESALSEILALANKPELNKKELQEVIQGFFVMLGIRIKRGEDTIPGKELAETLCSHFSKPKIKYPKKKEYYFPNTPFTTSGDAHFMERVETSIFNKGYNQAIDDMRKLNGGGKN